MQFVLLSMFTYWLDVKSDNSTTMALNVGLLSGDGSQHFSITSYLQMIRSGWPSTYLAFTSEQFILTQLESTALVS